MHLFLVVADGISETVRDVYPDKHHVVAPNAWVVADEESLSSSVSQRLGFTAVDDGGKTIARRNGVVVSIDNYYGVFDSALWQRMAAWSNE